MTIRVNISFGENFYKRLKQSALEDEVSVSAYVRRCVEACWNEEQKRKASKSNKPVFFDDSIDVEEDCEDEDFDGM